MTGDDIRRARGALGLTQAQLAAVMGYSGKSRIAELEAGTRSPGPAAIRLLRAYGAGYRPPDWPLRKAEPVADATPQIATMPVDEKTVEAVVAAQRQGAHGAGDIAKRARLGLLTVKDALAEIERRREVAPSRPTKRARVRRGIDIDLHPPKK